MKTSLTQQVELIRAINAESGRIAHQTKLLRVWLEENGYDIQATPRVRELSIKAQRELKAVYEAKFSEIALCPSCREVFPSQSDLDDHKCEIASNAALEALRKKLTGK